MTQIWDTQAYEKNGAFVHGMAGGVLELLVPGAGERILDLGCGDGQLTQRIAASGADVVAWMRRRRWLPRRVRAGLPLTKREPRRSRMRIEASTPSSQTRRCTGCAIRTQ